MSIAEFDIIRDYFKQSDLNFYRPGLVLGIGDDAALLQPPPNYQLALTVDTLVESIHFPVDADPARIAHKALAVNLSDLAAMGAEPFCFTLSLVLPKVDEQWLAAFSQGMLSLAQRYQCPLVGGDITRGPLTITIQAQGLVQADHVIRRDGAEAGDLIYVSGSLGDSAIAVIMMELTSHLGPDFVLRKEKGKEKGKESAPLADAVRGHFEQAYFEPQPRIELAKEIGPLVSAGIDISDGLAGDLGHVMQASGVSACLYEQQIPVSALAVAAVGRANALRAALYGGDDYELCVTVHPDQKDAFEAAADSQQTVVTCIGEVIDSQQDKTTVLLCDAKGVKSQLSDSAYQHFND